MYGSQEALLSAEFARKLYDAPRDHNEVTLPNPNPNPNPNRATTTR